MAAVYKAVQPAMERYVAIKVLPRQMANSQEFVARFQREAKLLAQLQHPHILPVFDYGETDGYPYIVMPYIQSGTLAELIKKRRLALQEVREIITQISSALGFAHTRGMVHRDIKPSNVLIDDSGNCLLTDFGLARMINTDSRLTSDGAIMGTPMYMSPEQGAGTHVDHRSDIYALGVILYEMVTGRVPYTAETPIAIVFKHIQDPLPSARKYYPELSAELEMVLLKSLAKRPEDRYQSAEAFMRAVQAAIPAGTIPVPRKVVAEAVPVATPPRVTVPPSRAEAGRASSQLPKSSSTISSSPNSFQKLIPLLAIGAFGLVGLVVLGGAILIFGMGMARGNTPPAPQGNVTSPANLPLPPTLSVPPGIPFARITSIHINDQQHYAIDYQALEFSEHLPGTHVHFFFNTVGVDQAGVPGKGPWKTYGGPHPFLEYKTTDRPKDASQLCVLVANPNESIQPNSGNCFPLPDVVSVTMRVDTACKQSPDESSQTQATALAATTSLLLGKSADENWFYTQNPENLSESCWVPIGNVVINGDARQIPVK